MSKFRLITSLHQLPLISCIRAMQNYCLEIFTGKMKLAAIQYIDSGEIIVLGFWTTDEHQEDLGECIYTYITRNCLFKSTQDEEDAIDFLTDLSKRVKIFVANTDHNIISLDFELALNQLMQRKLFDGATFVNQN